MSGATISDYIRYFNLQLLELLKIVKEEVPDLEDFVAGETAIKFTIFAHKRYCITRNLI